MAAGEPVRAGAGVAAAAQQGHALAGAVAARAEAAEGQRGLHPIHVAAELGHGRGVGATAPDRSATAACHFPLTSSR